MVARKKVMMLVAVLASSVVVACGVLASGKNNAPLLTPGWSFEGPLGKFDKQQLRRGHQVHTEVCAACHSMGFLSYRNLADVGGPEYDDNAAKEIAAAHEVTDGPNEDGEMFERKARLSDKFVAPFPNVQAARAANNGAYPPDLSVITLARPGGPDYIYSLLLGYEDPPPGIDLGEGMYYNKFYPGHQIAMPQSLSDYLVEYSDGTEATVEQMAKDVVAFYAWAADPHLHDRHSQAYWVLGFLLLLLLLVWLLKREYWRDIK